MPVPPSPHAPRFLEDLRGRRVPYVLTRCDRRSWSIRVVSGAVEVRIPRRMSDAEAEDVVRRNASWILRQIGRATRRPSLPAPMRFADGESFCYLGDVHVLRLRAGLPLAADLDGDARELRLTLPPPADGGPRAEHLLRQWFQQRAAELFPHRVALCLEHAAAEGFPAITSLAIRCPRSRWGSCGADGHVMLNLNLLQGPVECIDYVVMHELCHLRELNHSSRFYAILTRLMPDWKVRRERLQSIPMTFSDRR